MQLTLVFLPLVRVGRGQTLEDIAAAFGTTPRLLAARNALTASPAEGTYLSLPPAENVYRVRGGETKTLLCGSPASYFARNATPFLYPGQTVVL